MKIAVCMKQVPAYSEGNMDKNTGALIRTGLLAVANIYDVSALEAALQIKEVTGAEITVFTMGPQSAEAVVREGIAIGADRGYLICDAAFAGADVLSTSYTLMQAIKSTDEFDLILCGRQTTDGDTAQVSGALAQWIDIPHINWVLEFSEITTKYIIVGYNMKQEKVRAKIPYPCLLSVEKNIFVPRMPSLKRKMAGKKKLIPILTLESMEDKDPSHYGFSGSATKVVKIFPPEYTKKQASVFLEGDKGAQSIYELLVFCKPSIEREVEELENQSIN